MLGTRLVVEDKLVGAISEEDVVGTVFSQDLDVATGLHRDGLVVVSGDFVLGELTDKVEEFLQVVELNHDLIGGDVSFIVHNLIISDFHVLVGDRLVAIVKDGHDSGAIREDTDHLGRIVWVFLFLTDVSELFTGFTSIPEVIVENHDIVDVIEVGFPLDLSVGEAFDYFGQAHEIVGRLSVVSLVFEDQLGGVNVGGVPGGHISINAEPEFTKVFGSEVPLHGAVSERDNIVRLAVIDIFTR